VQHLDPDRLVDLALFESSADTDESVHLSECPHCGAEMDALKHVAEIGAETQSVRDLPAPPESVWAGIVAATGVSAGTEPSADNSDDVVRPFPPKRGDGHRRRRPRGWLPPFLLATAAAVLAVVGTVAVLQFTGRPSTEVTARATLGPLAIAPPSARGDAQVLNGDALRVDVSDLPLTAGYYEVWLLNPEDPTKMQSLGSLPGKDKDVVLPIPPGTDLNTYRLVDVSAEAHDGNSAHSGDSLLRGTLTN
jgi:hypothetical protein